MNLNKDQEEKLISIPEIKTLIRNSKKTILYFAAALGLFGALISLIKPIRYVAEGTFREKGIKSNNGNLSSDNSIKLLLGTGLEGTESEATSLMTSRRILKDVIEKHQLQANLNAVGGRESFPKLVGNNLLLAWASVFRRSPSPVLSDRFCPLKIETLKYTGEIPLTYLIEMKSDGQYVVKDIMNSRRKVGSGRLGDSFHAEELAFVLNPLKPEEQLCAQSYILSVDTVENTAKKVRKDLRIEQSKLDKSILKLKYEHRNRRMASDILNGVMQSYQSYLRDYHQGIALNQLEYLGQRRDQLTQNLTQAMQRHADFLTNDLNDSGFIETEKEIQFLAASHHDYKQKLLDNELEIKRLTNIKPGHLAYYDRYSSNDGDPVVINGILSEMRSLKQQRDALEIELQKKPSQHRDKFQESFEQQFNELKEVQLNLTELRDITRRFQQGLDPDGNSKLLNDSRFLLKEWLERLQKAKNESPELFKETEENFQFYLSNLERSFGVLERILQERLTHQQNPSGEYQGISLEAATNLYLDYSKQLIQMEGTIRQNSFFIGQIEDPNFEITSLSFGLEDPVSSEMIRKASDLVMNLRDQNNQSIREQERIKEELGLQRTFLKMHLKQMVQLMELNKQLFNEKIFALQNVSLELIHQRIFLLEKNLQDYLKSRLENLEQGRTLIQRHLDSIRSEMIRLPQKWASEQLINQEVETNQLIVEEIAKLVESKNISHHLDVIQSAPVDLAYVPVHPLPSRFFLWGFLGFALGGVFGSAFVVGKGLRSGLNASQDNLKEMGLHVSGCLKNGHLDTLRRTIAYFDAWAMKGSSSSTAGETKLLLLIEGNERDYAPDLADLLLKRGQKVLILDLNFTEGSINQSPGLRQYLNGSLKQAPIHKGEHGDWIGSGGADPSAIEMINSPMFKELIERLKPSYDWILAVSSALPSSLEAQILFPNFLFAAITIKDEKVNDLIFYQHFLQENPQHKATFIV